MDLTLDEKFKISKTCWTDGYINNLQNRLNNFKKSIKADEVLKEIFINSYCLMEEIKNNVRADCDPFYEKFPFLMYGTGRSIYAEDQLFLLKQRKSKEQSDKSILYLPNEEFKSKFISGNEEELKKGESFRIQCILGGISVNSAYCKDSNSIWLDKNLMINAILGILVSRHKPDEYSPVKNGTWDEFFEGLSHEFGHYLYKTEYQSIGSENFVNHQQSKAHQIGTRFAKMKSTDEDYVNNFFSLIVQ